MRRLAYFTLVAALSGAAAGASARDWGGMWVPLDEADLVLLERAAESIEAATGAAADAPVTWENPKNGTRGTIQAARRFEHEGAACVQYRLRIEVRTYEPFASTPVLCQSGGQWKLMNKSS